jgi:hypothetical protein
MRAILLSVLNRPIVPQDIEYLSFHENKERKIEVNYLDGMNYVFVELSKFNKLLNELKSIEDYWIFPMKEAEYLGEIPQNALEEVRKVYEILDMHIWSIDDFFAYEKASLKS